MAVIKKRSSRYDYTCLSGDTKPTARVFPSSVAIETDTHDEYLFNGVSWGVHRTPVYPKMWNAGTLSYDAMTQPLISTDTLSVNADVTDDATRDLGKVDVASLDQYTPNSNRLPVYATGNIGIDGYRSSDSTYQPLRLDKATNTIQVINYEHHEIHAGSHFYISGVSDLTINQVLDFTWQMPNSTKWTHWLWKIDTESETAWYVYETAVVTNALANAITPLNSDRNSLTASGTTMKYEVQANLGAANADTDVTTATLIDSGISGAGKSGGFDSRDHELILKQNTLYCLRAVATTAGYINFNMHWYEHVNIA